MLFLMRREVQERTLHYFDYNVVMVVFTLRLMQRQGETVMNYYMCEHYRCFYFQNKFNSKMNLLKVAR